MRIVINHEAFSPSADLSKIPLFVNGNPQESVMWTEITREQFKQVFELAMEMFFKYPPDTIGSKDACSLLGTLEDSYPEWFEELEELA